MKQPTLVLGTGRCGSTLVSQMIRQHPTVLSISELFSFVTDLGARIERAFPAHELDGPAFWRILAEPQPRQSTLLRHDLQMGEVFYPWERGRFTPEVGLPPILQGLLPHLAPEDPEAVFDDLARFMNARGLASAADHYRATFEYLQGRYEKQSWAERSGGGLRVGARPLRAFPEAKVLHIVRDGRNTALSMSRHIGFRMALIAGQQVEFLGVDPYESDDRSEEDDLDADLVDLLPENFTKQGFEDYDLHADVCAHYWSGEICEGLAVLSQLPPNRLLTLRYEDFLETPETAVRRMGEFLDPESLDDRWIDAAVAQIGQGRSAWRNLPTAQRDELDRACRRGFDALASMGVTWP